MRNNRIFSAIMNENTPTDRLLPSSFPLSLYPGQIEAAVRRQTQPADPAALLQPGTRTTLSLSLRKDATAGGRTNERIRKKYFTD